jgi:hypothetical protein
VLDDVVAGSFEVVHEPRGCSTVKSSEIQKLQPQFVAVFSGGSDPLRELSKDPDWHGIHGDFVNRSGGQV